MYHPALASVVVFPPSMAERIRVAASQVTVSDPVKMDALSLLGTNSIQVTCDKAGRITLNEHIVKEAKLEHDVIFRGGFTTFHISSPTPPKADRDSEFALTILRAFENNICTSGDFDLEHRPGDLAQGIGKHHYNYRIHPGATGSDYQHLFQEADSLHAPMVVAESKARAGDQPMEKGHIGLDNQKLALSGIKKAARSGALIVRLFNTTNQIQQGKLLFSSSVAGAAFTNLNEEVVPGDLSISGNELQITVEPKKIVTISVDLAVTH
jgi:hypothetical protein